MATPNYSYEKRQKELAKKRKKEDKLKRKAEGHPDDPADDQAADVANVNSPDGEPAQPGTPPIESGA